MSTEILIVDDNADIRNIINELIIDAGYNTRVAANFNQALMEIDKKLPDVAIIDVKLHWDLILVLARYIHSKYLIRVYIDLTNCQY